MAFHGQYFKHKDGQYEPALASDRPKKRKSPPFSFDRLEKQVKFVLVEVVPKLVKFLVMLTQFCMGKLVRLFLPAQRKSVRGQVVLVTGGANGLGKALCERFAKEGCSVAVADIDLISAQKTAKELQQQGCKAEAFKVDVADHKSVAQLRQDIEAVLGPVDILVNNAGLLAMLSLSEGTPEDVQRILGVNLVSHFWTIREFKAGMVKRRRGHIVAISSVLGVLPSARTICYCSTKFGVRGLMASLNEELYMDGLEKDIHTSCVFPAGIITRKQFVDFMTQDLGLRIPWHTPEYVANVIVEGVLENKTEIVPSTVPVRFLIRYYDLLPRAMLRIRAEALFGKLPALTPKAK
uniref:Short-chain dehydrogenase/reductase 3 n=1 Tax=Culex tarsalis TaxID=7177 RepID=A0A1Q3FKW9_CULTA